MVMSAVGLFDRFEWQDRMVRWYLSDNNPPTASGELIKLFVSTGCRELLVDSGFMDLLLVASRFATDVGSQ